MRIGLIVPGFSAHEGDWCIPALLDLVRGLGRDHPVHVFALRYPTGRRSYEVAGARVDAFGGGVASGLARLPLLLSALRRIVSEGRRRPFDVLHGIWADEPGWLAVAAGRILRVPAVVSVAGGELVGLPEIGYGGRLGPINRWMAGIALRRADAVTVGSHLMAVAAREHGATRPVVLPFGVDLRRFSPAGVGANGRANDSIRLLQVASLSPVKDQDTLLDAFARVCRERTGVSLELVGEGPMRARLEARCDRLGIGDRVAFRGKVPHDRLAELYRAAHLFVLSSRHESQSLAALEAAACGTPVVGTAVGVVPELAPADCVTAVGDIEALASAILRLVDDGNRRAFLGRTQSDTVQRRYALERSLEEMVALYRDIATISPATVQKSR